MSFSITLVKGQVWSDPVFSKIVSKYDVESGDWSSESYLIYLWLLENVNQQSISIKFQSPELAFFPLLALHYRLVFFDFKLGQYIDIPNLNTHAQLEKNFLGKRVSELNAEYLVKNAPNERKKVTLCICTYNRSKNIPEIFELLMQQTRLADEIVVIDDGSSEAHRHSNALTIKAYELKLPIKYIYQDNKGARAARNTAAKNASFEVLIFLDDDNLPMKTMISDLLFGIENLAYQIVVSPYERLLTVNSNELGKTEPRKRRIWVPIGGDQKIGLLKNSLGDMHMAIYKSVYQSLGGLNESSRMSCEDWILLYRAIKEKFRIVVCPRVTQVYRDHTTSFLKMAPKVLSEGLILGVAAKYQGLSSTLNLEMDRVAASTSQKSQTPVQIHSQLYIIGDANEGYQIKSSGPIAHLIVQVWCIAKSEIRVDFSKSGQINSLSYKIPVGFLQLNFDLSSKEDSIFITRLTAKAFFFVDCIVN